MILRDRHQSFIDIETTGLDPHVHEILEFSIIRRDPSSGIESKNTIYFEPQHIHTADPKALEINGYDPESNTGLIRKHPLVALDHIISLLKDTIIIGHNVSFDLDFIKAQIIKYGLNSKDLPYHKVDTVTLAFEHLAPLGLTSLSLKNVCDFLNISNDNAHTSSADVHRTVQVFDLLNRPSLFNKLKWRYKCIYY